MISSIIIYIIVVVILNLIMNSLLNLYYTKKFKKDCKITLSDSKKLLNEINKIDKLHYKIIEDENVRLNEEIDKLRQDKNGNIG